MDATNLNKQHQVAIPLVDRQIFLNEIVETLSSYKWPKGSIECIDPSKTRLVFLPGNRYKGKTEGTWTAKVDGDKEITVNDNQVNIPDGTPYSGTIPEIDFDVLVINDNDATPFWAKGFTTVGFVAMNYQPMSYIEAVDGIIEGDDSGNPHMSWMKYGNEITDRFLLPYAAELSSNGAIAYLALDIVPAEVIEKSTDLFSQIRMSSRDIAVSSRNSVSEEPVPVLIPFYVLEFQFEGKNYHLAMMADASTSMKGQVPPVAQEDLESEQVVTEENSESTIQPIMIKWGWILSVVFLLLGSFLFALVVLIIWAIAKWKWNKKTNEHIEKLENQKVVKAQDIADKLRRQLIR